VEETDRRLHGTVKEVVGERFERERSHLGELSPQRFDTSCFERRVVAWDGYIAEFLTQALLLEWKRRNLKGVESRLSQARLPCIKTLEAFDFGFQPSIGRKVIGEPAGLSFVERAENAVLLGPPGVGKTHPAIALGVKAVEAVYRIPGFCTTTQLVSAAPSTLQG